MNEATRPELPPAAGGDAACAAAFRVTPAPPAAAPPPRPAPPVPDLQASDLVVEMVRTALDDQATAALADAARAGVGGGADAAAAPSWPGQHPAAPPPSRPAALPDPPRDMAAPLDPASLMHLQGEGFIRRAYLELLDREPDERDTFYATALAEGRLSKGEILGGIRFSEEGKAVGREVRGIKGRVLLSRAYRLPVVGRLVRIGTAVAGLPGTLHHLRRLEQALAASVARMEAEALAETENTARAAAEAELRAKAETLEAALSALPDARALVAEAVARGAERGRLTDDAVVSLADRLEALEAAAAEAAERLDALPAAAAAAGEPTGAAYPSLEALYVAFEDKFRGAREVIKQRQAVYLPLLEECGAGTLARPVVDVGCGRGEWLELLRDRGLVARGVDLNGAMVEACRGLGLDAVAGDAVEHLRAAAPGSLGAVTGFHIIEHLPFAVFVRLLDAALRALAPGGAVVFETPNPDNVLVGSRNFYLDPTHRNPLPKEMTVMIAEARGFSRAHARPLHPMDASFGAADEALGEKLDGLFYGPQDYALVAWKP